MSLDVRKHAELLAKCQAFDDELSRWSDQAKQLPQHTSQLTRLAAVFGPLAVRLSERITAVSRAEIVAESYALAGQVLVLFRTWAFYRQKLEQRFVPWQRDFLEVADELAYGWWKPAQDAALQAARVGGSAKVAKEPPLLFLNGDVSPFTITRQLGFRPEAVEGLDGAELAWCAELLRRSPVPVIGVPYFASRHIPDLMVIAHEVGHNVEDDFELTADLLRALDGLGLDANRSGAWRAWLGEIFADLWGVLSCGPAFVDALVDLIADARHSIEAERAELPNWGSYPTTWLRASLLFAALDKLGMAEEAAARRAAFLARYPRHAMDAFETDIAPLVSALLACEPRALGCSVRAASGFNLAAQRAAVALGGEMASGFAPPEGRDVSILAPAITLAFGAAPQAVAARERTAQLWATLRKRVKNGKRTARPSAATKPAQRHDAELANRLFEQLTVTAR